MVDQEEAKGTLGVWKEFWEFIQCYCLGRRTKEYIQSGQVAALGRELGVPPLPLWMGLLIHQSARFVAGSGPGAPTAGDERDQSDAVSRGDIPQRTQIEIFRLHAAALRDPALHDAGPYASAHWSTVA